MNTLIQRINFYLIIYILITVISITKSDSIKIYENTLKTNQLNQKYNINKKANYDFRFLSTENCATMSYSKSDIQDECDNGPSSYDRILKYKTFSNYISNHDYHSNGLYYVTSLLVDSETHHFGNFMNDGVGMIILYIIDGLILLAWIPLLCCWRKRCCLFDDCLYEDDCCIIFWHILTYFLAAAILSFILVVLCFGE